MFLLRTAFWLSLVIMFLPAGSSEDGTDVKSISAYEAYFAAQTTLGDLSRFCERNVNTCETGGVAISAFGQKARYGARKVYEYLDVQFGDSDPADPEVLAVMSTVPLKE